GLLPEVDRLAKRRWERLGLARLIGVALQLRARVDLVLDSVQAGREQSREGEIGIRVRARYPALDPARLAMADDPEAAGAVVATPGDRGRRPALRREALVRVDRGRHE